MILLFIFEKIRLNHLHNIGFSREPECARRPNRSGSPASTWTDHPRCTFKFKQHSPGDSISLLKQLNKLHTQPNRCHPVGFLAVHVIWLPLVSMPSILNHLQFVQNFELVFPKDIYCNWYRISWPPQPWLSTDAQWTVSASCLSHSKLLLHEMCMLPRYLWCFFITSLVSLFSVGDFPSTFGLQDNKYSLIIGLPWVLASKQH